jgi:hypothetical protein
LEALGWSVVSSAFLQLNLLWLKDRQLNKGSGMSFFDDIRAKAEELMGGAGEQLGSSVEDVSGQVEEATSQVEEVKNNILPGEEQGDEQKN